MRINQYLAKQGVSTRRGADELIVKGAVRINGRVAVLGDQVSEGDEVEVVNKQTNKKLRYYAYNKPVGEVTGSLAALPGLFPLGRLDKESSGLVILTNDGRVTDRLLNPDYDHDKEYRVQTALKLRDGFKKAMEGGVNIGGLPALPTGQAGGRQGYRTRPCLVRPTGPTSFVITLTEGKKHQIRRMLAALYNSVVTLERTRILTIKLGGLKPGSWRPLEGEELATFLSKIGLK